MHLLEEWQKQPLCNRKVLQNNKGNIMKALHFEVQKKKKKNAPVTEGRQNEKSNVNPK